jgi:D-alanyl-D-alanine carboxypeptidase
MRASICAFTLFLYYACTSGRADKVDEFVQSEMTKREIPGLALAVIRTGHETKSAAYGFANLELQSPARVETVFEIGSLTKQFTAAGILMLSQEGRLSVDDRIGKHLPGIPSGWTNITIRHLLNHTSGIKSYTGLDGFELRRRLNQQQFIKTLGELPADFSPDDDSKYSNSGYNLLGFIIENVSGKNYWACLSERVLGPLGMTSTTNRDPVILVPNRADGYLRKGGVIMNRDSDLTDVFAAGAIVSTIGDLAKWNAALDTEKLLSSSSKAQMWTRGKLNNGKEIPYGFGWRIDEFQGHKNIGHSGSTSGFSASLQRFPDDKLTVVVLCNSDEPNIATTLARAIAGFCFKGDF